MIDTGAFTDQLLVRLKDASNRYLVGDGIAPKEGGWSGSPDSGVFIPYTVLTCLGGAPRNPGPNLDQIDWQLTFSLRTHAASRLQVDKALSLIRPVIDALDNTLDSVGVYTVRNVTWESLGGVTRTDQGNSAMWSVTDSFGLVCLS